MPSYKLTYFHLTGLAEPIRLLFSYAGIDFVDEPMPFGKVPVLEVDGKRIHQSVAIGRYVAKQCGLAGKNDLESLEIDSTVDTIQELLENIYVNYVRAKEQKLEIVDETVSYYLERLDAQVKRNGGYFVGGALTWADLTFVGVLDYMNFLTKENVVEKYENLKQLRKKVEEIPAIKSWIEKRPPTLYENYM
ncbi:Glutathione S-transferase [Temnothorax longispinosus]|uniref:glutathione transferase n=1 Tax=Temnothorax longispinosus TaxID=300112 RepID=A0A4S2KTH7_9HYME|nr:Glutathione S-transferase [Temnothorax longispinosus]